MIPIRTVLLLAALVVPAGPLLAQDPAQAECDAVRAARAQAREARALVERHARDAARERVRAERMREEVARAMDATRPSTARIRSEAQREAMEAMRQARREALDAVREARRSQERMERRRTPRGTVEI